MNNKLKVLDKQLNNLSKFSKRNAPTILTVTGVCGFVSTIFMAVRATPKAMDALDKVNEELPEDAKKSTIIFEKTKAVAPIYASTVVMGATSIACVLEANKISSSRLAAVTTAYELSDKAFKEYREAVVEKFGEKKELEVEDQVAKKHVEESRIEDNSVMEASLGTALFLDSISGRYFRSTKDDIYKALIRFRDQLISYDYSSVNDWYDCLDNESLSHIKIGDKLGFNSTAMLEIYFSVQEAPNGEPVYVMEYRTAPTYDFAITPLWD